jgi:cytochrome c553
MKPILKWCQAGLFGISRVVMRVAQLITALLGPAPGWTGLKRWLLQISMMVLLAGLGGFFVAAMGLVPITASSGHWPITAWFLNFTMSRSVSTHSLGTTVPALDDSGMVIKGATHYHRGCFPCHGNPAIHHPRIARQMTPHPPYLPPVLHEWKPEELFYIVKHGVKFTGMPAWPTQERDDEVWAIVAFLQKFPELDEQEYSRMVNGEEMDLEARPPGATGGEVVPIQTLSGRTSTAHSISDRCGRCHGEDGQGREAGVAPKLAGQQQAYLQASLEAYVKGDRPSGIMEPIAVGMSREEIREAAIYFSDVTATPPTESFPASELAISRGERIALEGVPKLRVPICAQCHGPGDNLRNAAYPILAGQYADYLVQQLQLFADKRRGGSAFASLMHPVADRLTLEQMRDVAQYYESLVASKSTNKDKLD